MEQLLYDYKPEALAITALFSMFAIGGSLAVSSGVALFLVAAYIKHARLENAKSITRRKARVRNSSNYMRIR
jgi:hypothetical protein